MKTKNKIITIMMLAFSAISLASCGDEELKGTYSHDYPAPGSIVIPGTDGFDANGYHVWLGGGKDCKINLYEEVSNPKGSWDYNYYLDVYIQDPIDGTWDIPLTYANGNRYIGRTNDNYKKIEVGGWKYKK